MWMLYVVNPWARGDMTFPLSKQPCIIMFLCLFLLLLHYQSDSKKPIAIILLMHVHSHTQSMNESINHVMMSIVTWQQLTGLLRKKKHSELYVEDSGNIRNIHAMPNFTVKGIRYDETNM